MQTNSNRLALCLIRDDKVGHYTQLNGLLQALSKYFEVDARWIAAEDGFVSCYRALADFSKQTLPVESSANTPNSADVKTGIKLVAGAGGATWRYLAMAKLLFGLKTLVLLRPRGYPHWCFDMIAAPIHDGLREGGKILCTEGVINPMLPAQHPNREQGLILIGGPSRHHGWHEDHLLKQIEFVLASKKPPMTWTITTSRRTPETFVSKLNQFANEDVHVMPENLTPPNWVREQLRSCGVAWVTEDSVSMVSEGLTAGIQVGLLSMPRLKSGRVANFVDSWVDRKWITPFSHYERQQLFFPPVPPLQEADRVAEFVASHLRTSETA